MYSALAMQDIPEIRDRDRTLQAGEPPHDLPPAPEPKEPTGWVARAKERDLPTFSKHQGAFAYLPRA